MKGYLVELLQGARTPWHGRHLVREYLQARILAGLQRAGAMIPLAFQGGTALRFLYGIPRYSEDLDFALEGTREYYDLQAYARTIRSDLSAEGYPVELRVSDHRVVQSAFVRFQGLLHELGLSPHASEVLSIKLEVDTQPPNGAGLATTVVRRHVLLHLQHHDRASLLAGKLHAILQRPYAKGRDLYDLFWYLSDPEWPAPNLVLLDNALKQTGYQGEQITADNWRAAVGRALSTLDWRTAVADVRPFLMDPEDAVLLTPDNLARVLAP